MKQEGIDRSTLDRPDLQPWFTDVRNTVENLNNQRQRCEDMPQDSAIQIRIRDSCFTVWNIQAFAEVTRLRRDLNEIDPELAAQVEENVERCINIPETAQFNINILNNIF